MHLSDFDFQLPKNLIAQNPTKPRDYSRLLILDKDTGEIEHKQFFDIINYLNFGDVLVLNNSKVFPARLIGKKVNTGGGVEVFLLERKHLTILRDAWLCLVGGKVKEGLEIEFDKNLKGKLIKNNQDGTWDVEFNKDFEEMMLIAEKIGKTPLPPYIKSDVKNSKIESMRYQTIYAEKVGSVAAPTAGLHFTSQLIQKLIKKGIQIEYVTLHVGLGTFAPVKMENILEHKMHAEWVEVDKDTAKRIIQAKKSGQKIIAVGTTSVRTLEGCVAEFIDQPMNKIQTIKNQINIFIYPGYKFKLVDAMITNFHLPKSTLLMLVSALAGKEKIDLAYQEAITKKYRFYSYGDAMLIN